MTILFGTDGIRGPANKYPMIPEIALNVGRAVVSLFSDGDKPFKVLIGRDTRISGSMLEMALASGILSMGKDAIQGGVLPTPAIAAITASGMADLGIAITASHNPFEDNGIKIFKKDGYKLTDREEEKLEKIILSEKLPSVCEPVRLTGKIEHMENATDLYCDFLAKSFPPDFICEKLKIMIDCSNGATYKAAPAVFKKFCKSTEVISVNPDGININKNCGSEHPYYLAEKIKQARANGGFAFDGDGDRIIAIDENGNRITGDQILGIFAWYMQKKGLLQNNVVVSTKMSNMGLKMGLKQMGIRHMESDVGDRYVVLDMIKSKAVLGGEDSGHIVFLDCHTTGDGILTGLRLLQIMKDENKPLSELASVIKIFPQKIINVPVSQKPDIETLSAVVEVIKSVEQKLKDKGRVFVRYSGTQPLCRVMVEGPSMEETEEYCAAIAGVIRKEIGGD